VRVGLLTVLLIPLSLASPLVLLPNRALAQGDDAETAGKITKMNVKAIEEYENLNFDEARKILERALEVSAQSGLDRHPITARTHVHLGVVLFAGFKKRDLALKQFGMALDVQPDIKLTKNLANPEVQALFDEAVAAARPASDSGATPTGETLEQKIVHKPITSAPHRGAVAVEARLGPGVEAAKMVLGFRPDGATTFVRREMKEISPGRWSGQIPASATAGDVVAYYLEALDSGGDAVASRGSTRDPFVVNLEGRAPGAPPEEAADAAGGSRWFVGLSAGGGVGWTTGSGEVNPMAKVSPAGLARAKLGQASPEIGYFVSPTFLLSARLRYQSVSGATARTVSDQSCGPSQVCNPPKSAWAGFLRATWLWGEGAVHPYLAATAGAGGIRHVTEFPSLVDCGSDPAHKVTCVDTVEAGPVFAGGGAGLFLDVSDHFAFTLGLDTLLGFPRFTLHADLNAGVAVEF
jgi:hypothetical protein